MRRASGREVPGTQKWCDDDAVIASALASVEWKAMLKAPSLSPQDTEFWHKLRLHQLYSWASADREASCAGQGCAVADAGSSGHIFWRCPTSDAVWNDVLRRWGRPPGDEVDLKAESFGWRTPPTHWDWQAVVTAHPDFQEGDVAALPTRLDHWLDTAWVHLTTATARCFWADLVSTTVYNEHPVCSDRLSSIMSCWTHRLGVLQDWNASKETARLDRLILRCIARNCAGLDTAIPRVTLSSDHCLLFFDGGSRGNPGPGGSGSVVVRVRDGFELVWVAAMSFAHHETTNNTAEFQGLITGLRAAVRYNWQPLSVIGDSNMILALMRRKKPPKARTLRPLFDQARRAAASLRVTGWHHHYRVHNKMADKAANIAMDARRSFQASAHDGRPELDSIRTLLSNDVIPWIERLLNSPLPLTRLVGS